MKAWVLTLGCVLAAAPAAGQGLRTPAAPGDAPVTVSTRVRHVTAVVLPETAEIVDLVVGDTERWDVSAAAHLAFVRPLVEGARSNVVLLTAAGAVVPLLVVESAETVVDAVVRVETPEPATADAGPVLAAADAVTAAARRAAEAWEAVSAAEERAAGRVEAARIAARGQLDAGRKAYPRQLHFDYRWPAGAADYPWLVEGMWHDGRRTYVRARALRPVFHEQADGGWTPVAASAVHDDVLHVFDRVLGAGALEVAGRRLAWSAQPRKAGP